MFLKFEHEIKEKQIENLRKYKQSYSGFFWASNKTKTFYARKTFCLIF